MIRNSSSPHIDFLSQNDIHSYNLEILNRSWTGQCWDICRRVWLLLYDFWFKEALQDVVMSPPRLSWLPTAYIVLVACLQHNREAPHCTFKTFISIITEAENNNKKVYLSCEFNSLCWYSLNVDWEGFTQINPESFIRCLCVIMLN